MSSCFNDKWTLRSIAQAIVLKTVNKKKLVVPMFQRGKRWTKDQQVKFIDSIQNGYPVGSMLFYESENDSSTYILVDGLQRGTCIKEYIKNPAAFLDLENVSIDHCNKILQALGSPCSDKEVDIVRGCILSFLQQQKTFENLQFGPVATTIAAKLGISPDINKIFSAVEKINDYYKEYSSKYNSIADTEIPVIIYHGAESNLPVIFDRINSQGTPLTKYEVFAAAWPSDSPVLINSQGVFDAVTEKYDSFVNDGYAIDSYDIGKFRQEHKLTAFEFLFGLGKYLSKTYKILSFHKTLKADETSPLAFELVDACFHTSNEIGTLYRTLRNGMDLNQFQNALEESIRFVDSSLSVITEFKGNKRVENRLLHSKFMILSMVASVFRAMYGSGPDFSKKQSSWSQKEALYRKNLLLYYVFDIVSNTWSEGGTTKIYKDQREERYEKELSFKAWDDTLNSFYNTSMQRQECQKPQTAKNEEIVILNAIYKDTFTAHQQLSNKDFFDIEHIAPKNQLKKKLLQCSGKLAISTIANLCYLPQDINRMKHDKNIYQVDSYTDEELVTIQDKYCFTIKSDLEWMNIDYPDSNSFKDMQSAYRKYCDDRFALIKLKLFNSLGIEIPII